jgi:hypothetical protein
MFAPLVAKSNAMQRRRSIVGPHCTRQSLDSQPHMLAHRLGNQAMLRFSAQRATAGWDVPDMDEKDNDATARTAVHAAAPWSFRKIPVFSPDSAERFHNPPAFPVPRLPVPIQTKLKIGAIDDPLEHEADRVADKVMRTPNLAVSPAVGLPQISRKCADCEEEEKVQKKAAGSRSLAAEAPASVHEVLGSPGQPLDAATRAYFEPRFGEDFSEVRVHLGASAERSAQEIGANAYTSGHNLVFAAGRFAPGTDEGRLLMAHELTHVVQQKIGHRQAFIQRDGPRPSKEEAEFEEKVLGELQRFPAIEEEGISAQEQKKRAGVLAARRERLFKLFASLHRAEADTVYERLRVRRAGDVLSERFYNILAKATREDLIQSLGLKGKVAATIVPNASDFCRPFSAREIAQGLDFETSNQMDWFIHGDLQDFFGNETAELYDTFLTSTEENTTPRIFDKPGSELVQSFVEHDATKNRERELAAIIEKNLPDNCGRPPANEWVNFQYSAVIPHEELKKGFSYGGFTIPGIVAGGISSGHGSIDSRTLSIKQVLLRRSETAGKTTGLTLRVQFHFEVKDAVDFCPGGMGSFLQQYVTIPLSRLEASRMAFSVPFTVRYDGPALEIELAKAAIDACSK